MPAITSLDLSNAKLDVDHIAAIATSTKKTATDRLGHTKLTVKGAVDTISSFNPRGSWVSGTTYNLKDIYVYGGIAYVTVVSSFTSSTVASDLSAGNVAIYQGVTSIDVQDMLRQFSAHFSTLDEILAITPTEITYSYVDEYSFGFGPEGGGSFRYDPSSNKIPDGVVVYTPYSNPTLGRWERIGFAAINTKMAGCKWDGSIDDTVNFQKALDYCASKGRLLVLPPGTGRFTSVTLKDSMFNFGIESQGCYLEASATVTTPELFKIINCVDFNMTGQWRWNGANKPNYRAMIGFHVQSGTAQSVTRINLYNHTFRNCGIGISNGDYNVDYQCSEINLFGCNFFTTPCPIYNGGANTGLQISGCNITSEHNIAFTSTPECAIWMEGGFLKLTGGSMVTNPTASACILFHPCSSALYGGNLYGSINIVGSHVESNSPLLGISNPRGFSSTVSDAASCTFIGNTGSSGGDKTQDFIYVGDATYRGLVEVKSNNWYAESPRTGYNMSGLSPYTRFSTDKTSLGKNFLNWLGGIQYGRVIHDLVPVTSVSGLGFTYTVGVATVLKFQIKNLNNELAKYGYLFEPATGLFTAPPGGFSRLIVQCGIAGTGTVSGDIYLVRTTSGVSSTIAYGTFNGIGSLNATVFDILEGETLSVVFKPFTSNYVTDTGAYNFIQISGETR